MAATNLRPLVTDLDTSIPVSAQVSLVLRGVEKQIESYLKETREREEQSSQDQIRKRNQKPLPSRPRASSPLAKCLFSASPTEMEIPLDLVFDTPECRTTRRSSAASPCSPNRRGATYHRIDSATADASELRSRQWTSRSQEDSYYDDGTSEASSQHTQSPSVEDSHPGKSSMSVLSIKDSHSPTLPRKDQKSIDVIEKARQLDQRRSRSLSQLSPASIEGNCLYPDPLRPRSISPCVRLETALGIYTEPRQSTQSGDSSSSSAKPSIQRAMTEPAATSNSFEASLSLELESSRLANALRLNNASDLSMTTLDQSEDSCTETERVRKRRLSFSRWLPKQAALIAERKRSSSKPAKQRGRERSAKALNMKQWGNASGSVTDLLSGKMFARVQADEIIDTTQIRSQSTPDLHEDHGGNVVETIIERPFLREEDHYPAESPPLEQHPAYRSSSYLEDLKEEELAQINTQRTRSVSPLDDDIYLTRTRQSRQQAALSTILESSQPLFNPDWTKEALPLQFPGTPLQVDLPAPGQRDSAADLPIPVSPSAQILHGPIRLTIAPSLKSTPELDWTAFQVAISGPTGDLLMGGGLNDDAEHAGSLSEGSWATACDEIVEWFESYRFGSEGLMLHGSCCERYYMHDHDDGACRARRARAARAARADKAVLLVEELDGAEVPVELPALVSSSSSSSSARSSAVATEPGCCTVPGDESDKARAEEVEMGLEAQWKPAANLNDLGAYLSFETYQCEGLSGSLEVEVLHEKEA